MGTGVLGKLFSGFSDSYGGVQDLFSKALLYYNQMW